MSKVQTTRYEQLQALAGGWNIKHYFVDEAGDLTLFDKRKNYGRYSPSQARFKFCA